MDPRDELCSPVLLYAKVDAQRQVAMAKYFQVHSSEKRFVIGGFKGEARGPRLPPNLAPNKF